MKNSQKGSVLAWVLILIMIVVAAGYYYFFVYNAKVPIGPSGIVPQQTVMDDRTNGWLEYNNSKYDFSVKYPQEWKFQEYPSDDGKWFSVGFRPVIATRKDQDSVTVYDKGYKSVDQLILDMKNVIKAENAEKITTSKWTSREGINFTVLTFSRDGQVVSAQYLYETNKYTFRLMGMIDPISAYIYDSFRISEGK